MRPATTHALPERGRSTVTPEVQLVAWDGRVEQLFFHPLVLRPKLAFTDDPLGQGFQDFFVTAREFRAILHELWRNGWLSAEWSSDVV